MGTNPDRPPLFDGENYGFWKNRMQNWIESYDMKIWKVIVKGNIKIFKKDSEGKEIPKTIDDWTDDDMKILQTNSKAKTVLYCALNASEYNRVSGCTTAQEIWNKLEVTFEGTKQVKRSKALMLRGEYESFKMIENEGVHDMFTRFTNLLNKLRALGKTYSNDDVISKMLNALPPSWGPKVTAIQEAKDIEEMDIDELLGSLITHEEAMKKEKEAIQLEKINAQAKKALALKSSINDEEDEGNSSEIGDETMALITRRFQSFLRNSKNNARQ
ncbi:hypothetical protein HGI15_21980, partial [Modestobacter lapidis]|nr:hypothetical protein [Modestobacter lapidis]